MSTTVSVKIKNENNDVVETQQKQISSLTAIQFIKVMKEVKAGMDEMQSNESLVDLFDELFGEVKEEKETSEEIMKNMDADFLKKMIGLFPMLFEEMPERAFKILAILSGIEKETIEKQDFFDLMDIYDAVVDENDIERLVARVKKSLEKTQGKLKFLNLKRKVAEQQATPTAVK